MLAVTAASCIGAALLIGSPAVAATAQPSCNGTQTTLPDGTVICAPNQAAPAPQERDRGLLPGGLLGEVLAPGADSNGTTTCSPGAVVTLFGRTTTCPAPVTPAPGTVIVTPPTARQSTVTSDLVVTH